MARTNGARVFREAAKHTRFVVFLRVAIPAAIAGIAVIIFLASYLSTFKLLSAFPIDVGKVSISGTKVTMESPRVNGYTADARPYRLTARASVQDLDRPDILELKDLEGHNDLKDGQHVTLTSINGIYDSKHETLKLRDHIVATSTSGVVGHFSEATVDMPTGNVVSDSPVEINLPNDGLLNADRMKSEQNGDVITFSGSVELTLKPEQMHPNPGAQPPAQEEPPSTHVVRREPEPQPPARQTTSPRRRN